MKHIIVKGKPELRKHICQCVHCGCQFDYVDDDVYKNKPRIVFAAGVINGPVKCVTCPWCLEEIRVPDFDNGTDYMTPKRDSDVSTDEKTSAGSYEVTDDLLSMLNDYRSSLLEDAKHMFDKYTQK